MLAGLLYQLLALLQINAGKLVLAERITDFQRASRAG